MSGRLVAGLASRRLYGWGERPAGGRFIVLADRNQRAARRGFVLAAGPVLAATVLAATVLATTVLATTALAATVLTAAAGSAVATAAGSAHATVNTQPSLRPVSYGGYTFQVPRIFPALVLP